jgi:hypothetical protein
MLILKPALSARQMSGGRKKMGCETIGDTVNVRAANFFVFLYSIANPAVTRYRGIVARLFTNVTYLIQIVWRQST